MTEERAVVDEGTELRHTVGRRLADARTKKGLTQLDVAKRLSRPQSAVSEWERGIRTPSLEDIVALADLYGVRDIDRLMS